MGRIRSRTTWPCYDRGTMAVPLASLLAALSAVVSSLDEAQGPADPPAWSRTDEARPVQGGEQQPAWTESARPDGRNRDARRRVGQTFAGLGGSLLVGGGLALILPWRDAPPQSQAGLWVIIGAANVAAGLSSVYWTGGLFHELDVPWPPPVVLGLVAGAAGQIGGSVLIASTVFECLLGSCGSIRRNYVVAAAIMAVAPTAGAILGYEAGLRQARRDRADVDAAGGTNDRMANTRSGSIRLLPAGPAILPIDAGWRIIQPLVHVRY